jgi:hypothetical protein
MVDGAPVSGAAQCCLRWAEVIMRWSWALGLVLVGIVVAWVALWLYGAWRSRTRVDLMLDDLNAPMPELKRRRGEFVDDTAPAVLSVPPELERPEWERPPRDREAKRSAGQGWRH